MNFKKEIELLLADLKEKGYDRGQIEKSLGYSENYIDQQLSKGGNKRFVNTLKKFLETVLQKPIPLIEEQDGDKAFHLNKLILQQNKLIETMTRQSETANAILKRLTENVESRVERIDSNLIDALGRVDGLRFDLYAGIQVGLESLTKLQGLKPGALLKQADNIKLGLLKELSGQSKSAGKGK